MKRDRVVAKRPDPAPSRVPQGPEHSQPPTGETRLSPQPPVPYPYMCKTLPNCSADSQHFLCRSVELTMTLTSCMTLLPPDLLYACAHTHHDNQTYKYAHCSGVCRATWFPGTQPSTVRVRVGRGRNWQCPSLSEVQQRHRFACIQLLFSGPQHPRPIFTPKLPLPPPPKFQAPERNFKCAGKHCPPSTPRFLGL